ALLLAPHIALLRDVAGRRSSVLRGRRSADAPDALVAVTPRRVVEGTEWRPTLRPWNGVGPVVRTCDVSQASLTSVVSLRERRGA
ncbi:MAG TPA: hypothetical protein VFG00_06865, partial [Acidothermaceae bacterium]|nr:hypothetical protein [Acidothermaceae bacterium]